MDHNLVIENKTAERYLLGELTDAERDAYEEHYFECSECAEELLCGSEFMMYAREVEQEMVRETKVRTIFARTPWLRPLAMAACGVLAVGLALGTYKGIVTQRAMSAMKDGASAQIVYASVVLGPSRSAEDKPLPANKTFQLRFVIPPGSYKAYRTAVIGPSPSITESFPREVKADEAKSPISFVITAGALKPGDYAIEILGVKDDSTLDKGNVTSLPFRLEIQK